MEQVPVYEQLNNALWDLLSLMVAKQHYAI